MNKARWLDSLKQEQQYFGEIVHMQSPESQSNPKFAATMEYGAKH